MSALNENRYAWREDSRFTVDAQSVGQALEHLARSLGKSVEGVTADEVVEAARSPDSPLHPIIYRLNDQQAAHEHRKEVARLVLRSIRITVVTDGTEKQSIAYVKLKVPDEGSMYVPTTFAARRNDLRVQMLEDARRGIDGWLNRYRNLEGVGDVLSLIEKASSRLESKIKRAKAVSERATVNAAV